MEFEWDKSKAKANLLKHGVDFADASLSLEDDRALVREDPDAIGEERYVALSMSPSFQVLVTVFTYREDRIRIISSRPASRSERKRYEGS